MPCWGWCPQICLLERWCPLKLPIWRWCLLKCRFGCGAHKNAVLGVVPTNMPLGEVVPTKIPVWCLLIFRVVLATMFLGRFEQPLSRSKIKMFPTNTSGQPHSLGTLAGDLKTYLENALGILVGAFLFLGQGAPGDPRRPFARTRPLPEPVAPGGPPAAPGGPRRPPTAPGDLRRPHAHPKGPRWLSTLTGLSWKIGPSRSDISG